MNNSRFRIMSLAALAFLTGAGLTQGAEQAKFHLPVTAHWGQAVLEPGDYTLFLPSPSLGQMNFRVTGSDKTLFELPLVTNIGSNSNASYLRLTQIGGSYFIREFSSASSGKAFLFAIPKQARSRQLARIENSHIPVYTN